MIYRYMQLIPERPATPNLDRWYAAISSRPAFKERNQARDHFWLDPPVQSQSWSWAPLAVLRSFTSTHRLADTFTRSPPPSRS